MILHPISLLILLLLPVPYVSSHGVVTTLTVNFKTSYPGPEPNASPITSPIRQVAAIDPVKFANNTDLNCGLSDQLANQIIEVMPGSTLSFEWRTPTGPWPHNTGPMMTYMASCGNQNCTQFNSRQAKWFKIGQIGRKSKGQPWVQQDVMDGAPYNFTLPSNIAPGQYLIRHEIIALHLASDEFGAEFYPSCTQVHITGSGNGAPNSNELVVFPGAYHDDDPGIWVNAFDPDAAYVFPGPPIAAFVTANNTNTGSSSSGGSPTSAGSSPNPASTSGGANSGLTAPRAKTCRLVKKSSPMQRRMLAL